MDLLDMIGEESKRTQTQIMNTGGHALSRASVWVVGATSAHFIHAIKSVNAQIAKGASRLVNGIEGLSMKNLAEEAKGGRELVNISDKEIASEVGKVMRQYHVRFAIERHGDKGATFHVAAKDRNVLEHALQTVSERLDSKMLRTKTREQNAKRISEKIQQKQQSKQTGRTHDKKVERFKSSPELSSPANAPRLERGTSR